MDVPLQVEEENSKLLKDLQANRRSRQELEAYLKLELDKANRSRCVWKGVWFTLGL